MKNNEKTNENTENDEVNLSKEAPLNVKIKQRGSKYRGVSRNGNQWQVLIMVNKKKRYIGTYLTEEQAARAYDRAALQNHLYKAKTNFDYTPEEIKEIINSANNKK